MAETLKNNMPGGRRHHGVTAKALKRALKKAGLKTSGSKRSLTLRAKKAHVMAGGGSGAGQPLSPQSVGMGGGRRRSRRSRKHWPFM